MRISITFYTLLYIVTYFIYIKLFISLCITYNLCNLKFPTNAFTAYILGRSFQKKKRKEKIIYWREDEVLNPRYILNVVSVINTETLSVVSHASSIDTIHSRALQVETPQSTVEQRVATNRFNTVRSSTSSQIKSS